LIYVVNSKNELNTQFVGKHPDETYVSLPGGVTPSAPPSSVTVAVGTGPHVPSSEEQQRSSRNQRIYAMVFTVIIIVFIIIMLKVMAG
jgi:hypothetical protein